MGRESALTTTTLTQKSVWVGVCLMLKPMLYCASSDSGLDVRVPLVRAGSGERLYTGTVARM